MTDLASRAPQLFGEQEGRRGQAEQDRGEDDEPMPDNPAPEALTAGHEIPEAVADRYEPLRGIIAVEAQNASLCVKE